MVYKKQCAGSTITSIIIFVHTVLALTEILLPIHLPYCWEWRHGPPQPQRIYSLNKCFAQIHLLLDLFHTFLLLFSKSNLLSPVCAANKAIHWSVVYLPGPTSLMKTVSFPQEPATANSYRLGLGSCRILDVSDVVSPAVNHSCCELMVAACC